MSATESGRAVRVLFWKRSQDGTRHPRHRNFRLTHRDHVLPVSDEPYNRRCWRYRAGRRVSHGIRNSKVV